MLLSIITPTYNRGYCLVDIYKNLLECNYPSNFEWIIIDDGSTDNTKELVAKWQSSSHLNIVYHYKNNEGKTNALFDALQLNLSGDYVVVLDSDDVFVLNFFEIIEKNLYFLSEKEIGLVFLKSALNGKLIGDFFKIETSTYAQMYFSRFKTRGDKLFIVKTDVYRDSIIRSFPNEKLIPEGVFYMKMSMKGYFRCINEVLYKGDYLKDGLTANVLKLAANNINGFILEKQMLQIEKLSFFEKIKNEIKYISYSFSANRNGLRIIKESNNKNLTLLLLLPVYIITFNRINTIKHLRKK